MTTRSGRSFKPAIPDMEQQTTPLRSTPSTPTEITAPEQGDLAGIITLLKSLMQERAEERRRYEEHTESRIRAMAVQLEKLQEQAATPVKAKAQHHGNLDLTRLSEKDNIEACLTTFERVMQAHEIPTSRWAFYLAPQLTGRAQQAYAALNEEDARSYAKIKAAILRRYNITEETYRQQFRRLKLKQGETPIELVTHLRDLAGKWLRDDMTAAELRDAIIAEQLLAALPEDVRIWVTERKPKSSTEAGQLAEDYIQARSAASSPSLLAPTAPTPRKQQPPGNCPRCGQPGHWASECPNQKEALKKCFRCNRPGHLSYQCTMQTASSNYCDTPDVGSGKPLHKTITPGIINGRPCNVLLDTGTTQSIVHSDYVSEDDIDGHTTICCAHGDTVTYPIAAVEVKIGDKKKILHAAVSTKLPQAALIGWDAQPFLMDIFQPQPHLTSTQQSPYRRANRGNPRLRRKRRRKECEGPHP